METIGLSRLIVVSQYPAKLRYQEWYPVRMLEYLEFFDEVFLLAPDIEENAAPMGAFFAPIDLAIDYEIAQIKMFLDLELRTDDILLLCDISFPGLFASVLYHKKPKRCFALCHGTAKNSYDYFSGNRLSKTRVERGYSRLFDAVFVATEYHRQKLRAWSNCRVVRFPLPRVKELVVGDDKFNYNFDYVGSVARPGIQKVNRVLEDKIVKILGCRVVRFYMIGKMTWSHYYSFLGGADFLLVTSREETYGYQVIDSLSVGTIPITPRAFSYPELLPDHCLYDPGDAGDAARVMRNVARMVRRKRGLDLLPKLWEDTFISETASIMLA